MLDMERKAYSQLLAWKNNPHHKPLILNGARQVGKTWLLKHFGEKEYRNVAYVNCDRSPQMEMILREGFDMSRIIRNISAMTNVDIRPHETLIILDEIQSIPKGLSSLKYFCEDAPDYDVAVAGSLFQHPIYELPVLLSQLRRDGVPHKIDPWHLIARSMLREVPDIVIQNILLYLPYRMQWLSFNESSDSSRHSSCEIVLAQKIHIQR